MKVGEVKGKKVRENYRVCGDLRSTGEEGACLSETESGVQKGLTICTPGGGEGRGGDIKQGKKARDRDKLHAAGGKER